MILRFIFLGIVFMGAELGALEHSGGPQRKVLTNSQSVCLRKIGDVCRSKNGFRCFECTTFCRTYSTLRAHFLAHIKPYECIHCRAVCGSGRRPKCVDDRAHVFQYKEGSFECFENKFEAWKQRHASTVHVKPDRPDASTAESRLLDVEHYKCTENLQISTSEEVDLPPVRASIPTMPFKPTTPLDFSRVRAYREAHRLMRIKSFERAYRHIYGREGRLCPSPNCSYDVLLPFACLRHILEEHPEVKGAKADGFVSRLNTFLNGQLSLASRASGHLDGMFLLERNEEPSDRLEEIDRPGWYNEDQPISDVNPLSLALDHRFQGK